MQTETKEYDKIVNIKKELLIKICMSIILILLVLQLTHIFSTPLVFLDNKQATNKYVMKPFSFPPSLEKKGITGFVISEHISDHMYLICNEVRKSDQNILIKKIPHIKKIIISLPGSGLLLIYIIRFCRSLIGFNELKISGNAVMLEDKLYLTVRISGRPSMTIIERTTDYNKVILKAAEHILKNIDAFTLGKYYYNKGDIEAMNELVKYIEYANPNETDLINARMIEGLCLFKQKQFKDALFEWEIVSQKDPNNVDSYIYQGWALDEMNKQDEAIKRFRIAIDLDPGNAGAYNNWGISLYKMGELNQAVDKFKMIVKLIPDYPQAYNNLGFLLFELNRIEEAITNIQKAIQLDQKNPDFYDSLTDIYLKIGKYENAIKQCKKIIYINPNNVKAYKDWGMALEKLGRKKEAAEKFKKAKELDRKQMKKK